ncbi:MAG: deoxyguanosinetriphosphate triphosphohydrolase [Paludibacteraceae bacterium]|nr:deoxyguanosinetriphosphate triphosphohydrolase [Paludibacteraceae bacterium]MBN2787108.1 deoxyguanosinetriphosphate triphosphohydrolase [Paludibacteraceae bacterium]
MMNWNSLLSNKRFGMEDLHLKNHDDRTEFQRDYDRLIFSAPFRRLQNKTQVFPLPGSVFVHNRLTHSLEVACVGRSLGNGVSKKIQQQYGQVVSPFMDEIGAIVSAACLAHDLGNPPFGHSGEKAIATYFSEGEGAFLKDKMTLNQWKDIITFEGNANAFRLLTHQFNGRRKGGFALTYSTLASIAKYPYSSAYAEKKQKFGFFQSEKDDFTKIAHELGLIALEKEKYVRHPLVYLVEAADDICYEIMDIEDAHKLKILTTEETQDLLLAFIPHERIKRVRETLQIVSDTNEQIAYLRSTVIGLLIDACVDAFILNETSILKGTFASSLIKNIPETQKNAYELCEILSKKRIYKSKDVVDIEIAGYNIIYTLINKFSTAVLQPEKSYSNMLLSRIPQQYQTDSANEYGKILAVLDFISGMTDIYALDLYKKINGMSLPTL